MYILDREQYGVEVLFCMNSQSIYLDENTSQDDLKRLYDLGFIGINFKNSLNQLEREFTLMKTVSDDEIIIDGNVDIDKNQIILNDNIKSSG